MGRPARIKDNQLTLELEDLIRLAGSMQKAAEALGLVPSTFYRSYQAGAYDKTTRQLISNRLPAARSAFVAPAALAKTQNALPDLLQIMHKLYTILPGLIAELEVVLSTSKGATGAERRTPE